MASTLHTGGDVMRGEDYKQGFFDGWMAYQFKLEREGLSAPYFKVGEREEKFYGIAESPSRNKPRKLSKWQKFVKEKSKLPRFKYKTGKRKGMVNMKAVAAAWKRVPKSKK